MSRLTRDGTAEPVSRDQILWHARGQGNIIFPCSADHEQDWQPYPVDPYSAICDEHISYKHTYMYGGRAYLQSMDFQRTTVQTSSLLLTVDFFFSPLRQPDPTRPISLTLTQTPTPADRVVPIHSWRPLGHSTVWADFVCVSGSVLYLVRTQSKK